MKNNSSNSSTSGHQEKIQAKGRVAPPCQGRYIPGNINDNNIIDMYINKAEDERTVMAKNDFSNRRRVTIYESHTASNRK